MNRRDLLKRLTGGAVGAAALIVQPPPDVAAQPSVAEAPDRLPGERGWTWYQLTGFKRCQNVALLGCQICARRTDGEYFYTQWMVDPAVFTPDVVNHDLANAMHTLETFRNCACVLGQQCAVHAEMFPPAVDQEDGEEVRL